MGFVPSVVFHLLQPITNALLPHDRALVAVFIPTLRYVVQAATCFVNDSLVTTVCIQYRPSQVAAAVVYLSYLYMGLPRVDTTLLETELTVVAGKTKFSACLPSPSCHRCDAYGCLLACIGTEVYSKCFGFAVKSNTWPVDDTANNGVNNTFRSNIQSSSPSQQQDYDCGAGWP